MRFNEGQLVRLRYCFAPQKPKAVPLINAWAAEDGVVLPPLSSSSSSSTAHRSDRAAAGAAQTAVSVAAADDSTNTGSSSVASLEARLSELLERARAPSSVAIEVAVSRFASSPASWTPRALHSYLRLYSATRGAVHALRAFTLVHGNIFQQHGSDGPVALLDSESVVGLLCCFGSDWSPAHVERMDALRSAMRVRAGLAFTVADVLCLHAHLRSQPAALVRLRRWAIEDGAFTWLPADIKRELEAAGK